MFYYPSNTHTYIYIYTYVYTKKDIPSSKHGKREDEEYVSSYIFSCLKSDFVLKIKRYNSFFHPSVLSNYG